MTGDTSGRYTSGDDDADGWRITCAIVTGASQPGREWSEEQLWDALVLRPTPGGAWLRRLRGRHGDEKARKALRRATANARRVVAASPAYDGRADAAAELSDIRALIEAQQWAGRTGDSELRVLLALLGRAERIGGRQVTASVRMLAELANMSPDTAQRALRRLGETWVARVGTDPEADDATVWRWHRPGEIRQRLTRLPMCVSEHPLPPLPRQGQAVPETHNPPATTDTRTLARVMGHDAMHAYGHGGAGGRILATLTPDEGLSVADLAAVLSYHRTTIARRLAKLAADGLVRECEGLYYQAAEIEPQQLDQAAEARGTAGRTAARAWRHAQERARRRAYLAYLASRPRPGQQSDPLVPLEAYDPETGELLPEQMHKWRGWDVSDPWRPVWRGSEAA